MVMRKIASGAVLFAFAVGSLFALADDDDDDDDHHDAKKSERTSVSAPSDPLYKAECGSCHLAYPPGLLPARSWQAMMGGLKDHFGENASLDKPTSEKISRYLSENAADHSTLRRSQKISKSIPANQSPLRFTDTTYFKRQHHEVSSKVFARKSIGGASNCVACHQRAESGVFSEDEIKIPK